MAFLEAYNISGDLPTGDGNTVSITIDGETRTPIAGMFFFTNATAFGSEAADEYWFAVLATADAVGMNTVYGAHNVNPSAVYGLQWNDVQETEYRAEIRDESGTRISRVGVSRTSGALGPKAGGWVLEHDDDNLGFATKFIGTLFFGDDRNVAFVNLPGATSWPHVETVGFEPKFGIWFGGQNTGGATSAYNGVGYHYGTTQASVGRIIKDAVSPSENVMYVSDTSIVTRYNGSTANRTRGIITDVSATSLTISEVFDIGGGALSCMGLVFDLDPAQSAYVGVEDSFTSATTGDYSISMGFRPQWMQSVYSYITDANTETINSNASPAGVFSVDSAGTGIGLSVSSRDNVNPTDAGTIARTDSGGGQYFSGHNNSTNSNATRLFSYTGVPLDDDGFSLRDGEYLLGTTPARKWPVLALSAATPTFTGYSSSLKLLLDASNRSATSTEVNGEAGVTFTATGGAGRTIWDADGVLQTTTGNELAWNTDPVTGVVGLQCHAAYQNEIQDSEDVEAASWGASGTLDAVTTTTGPDGVADSAQVITETDAAARSNYFHTRTSTAAADEQWTVYCLIKKDSTGAATRWPGMRMEFIGGTAERFVAGIDTSTGDTDADSVGADAGSLDDYGAIDKGDWWLFYVTATNSSDASNTTLQYRIYPAYGDTTLAIGSPSDAATGSATVFGHQATKSPAPLPYFKTTGTAAGPSADQPTASTGWYNALGGVLYADCTFPAQAGSFGSNRMISLSDGTTTDRWEIHSNTVGLITAGGVAQASEDLIVDMIPGGRYRFALACVANDFQAYTNGFASAAKTSVTMPSGISNIYINGRAGGTLLRPLMYLHTLRYYDTRIPDGGPQAGEDDLSLYNLSMGLVSESAAAGTRSSGSMGRRRRLGAIWKR